MGETQGVDRGGRTIEGAQEHGAPEAGDDPEEIDAGGTGIGVGGGREGVVGGGAEGGGEEGA